MKNIRYLVLLFTILISGIAYAQVMRNHGKINVSGGYMVINGSYQNESTGGITLDGIITVSGNWTNNGSLNGIDSQGTNGEVIFNGSGTQTIGGTANLFDFEKLRINAGSITEVTAGKGVTAYGDCNFTAPLVLKSTTTAFRPLIATFINKTTSIVTGNITMELSYTSNTFTSGTTGRSLYFSSPISDATASVFNVEGGTNLLWYQDERIGFRKYVPITLNSYQFDNITQTKGYILRSANSNVFKFTGSPNSAGSYTTVGFPAKDTLHYYLFGNPYPAVIDWDNCSRTNVGPTIWYRPYNGTMVVDTWNSSTLIGTNNNGVANVDGKIPPMQSVWVQANVGTTGSITVSENNRTHNWGSTPFLKSKAKQSNNLVRLYIYSAANRDEAVINQSDLAQNIFEEMDSRKYFLSDPKIAEIYTLSPEKYRLVIQSIQPIVGTAIFPIGMNIGTAGTYKYVANLSEYSGANNIFLEDKTTGIKQDLFLNPEYTFTSGIITDATGSRFSIIFSPAPKLSISFPTPICAPGTIDLTDPSITKGSDSDLTFTYWLDSKATIPYSTPSKAEAGTYYIKGTAANGSYSVSQPIEIIINPLPTIVASQPAPICSPSTVDLTSSLITNGSTSGLTYTYWTDKDATLEYATPNAATNGTYYIKGTTDKGCFTISEPILVSVNPKPTISVSSQVAVCDPLKVDLTSELITSGSTTALTFTYWTDKDATVVYDTPTSATEGNYYIKGTTDKGCYTISEPIVVSVNPKPTVTANTPAAVCDPLRVDLTSELITNGSTAGIIYTYWTDKDATVSYATPTAANSGSYYIKGTTDKGCFAISDAIVVTVNPKPLVVTTNPSPVIYPATVDLTKPEITVGSTLGLTFSYWLDNAATLVYPTPQTAVAGNYFIKGTIDLTGCFSIAGPVAVTILTDVDIDKTQDIRIYSSNKQIIVENCLPKSTITIYDITGRQYYSGSSRSEKEIIQFNFDTGLYIVRLVNSQIVKSQKVYLR